MLRTPYQLGVEAGLEKLGVSDAALTAGTAFLSPTLSGLTAEDGKGLQTSLAGIAGNLLGKKVLRSNLAGRLLGSGAATAASKAGAGLVSPDPEEIRQMKRRGEFSKWDFASRAARTAGMGALIGGGMAALGGAPLLFSTPAAASAGFVPTAASTAAASAAPMLMSGAGQAAAHTAAGVLTPAVMSTGTAALGGLGRGALSGLVLSPMVRNVIQGYKSLSQGDEAYTDKQRKEDYYKFRSREPYVQAAGLAATHPITRDAVMNAVAGESDE